ncbi:hypothetical protein ACWDG9_16965 [Streptomyces sp. NPDC001073]
MSAENTSNPTTDKAAQPATPALPQLHHPAYRVTGIASGTHWCEPAPWSAARLEALLKKQVRSPFVDANGLLCGLDNGETIRATPAPSHFYIRTCAECSMFEREHWSSLSCRSYRDPANERRKTYLLNVRLATTVEVTASSPAAVADLIRALANAGLTVTAEAPGLGLAEFGAATLDLGSVSLRQIDGQEAVLTCTCGKPLAGSLTFLRDSDPLAKCPECATHSAYPYDEPPF